MASRMSLSARLPGWLRGMLHLGETEVERLQRVRIPSRALVLFSRQFVVLLRGGVPLVQCLNALCLQDEYPDLGLVLVEVTRRVEGGHRLSEALANFPGVFSKIVVVMVQIGEKTGSLDDSMDRLAGWLERDGELMQRVRSALTYPAFIMALTVVLTLGLFYGVMPAFLGIFQDMHVELPLITRIVVAFTLAVRNPLAWLIGGLVLGLGWRQLKRTWADERGRVVLYRAATRLPVLGAILWNGSSARFCCAVSALLMSGSNLQSSLRLGAAVSGSPVLDRDVVPLSNAVMNGIQPSEYMMLHPAIYSRTMTHMAAAGEEASRLPEMFARASEFHGLEMESQVDALKAALEPMMLSAVAIIVGTIIFSVFLPLYGFLNKIS